MSLSLICSFACSTSSRPHEPAKSTRVESVKVSPARPTKTLQKKTASVPKHFPLIVLDPGHGGADPGASRGEEFKESLLTLDVARRVRDYLTLRLAQAKVVLTRETDTFITLEQRTVLANQLEAQLFVSIHVNDAKTPLASGGVTTFVLDITKDKQALRLAAMENGVRVEELSRMESLLATLSRKEQLLGSVHLAEFIQVATVASGRRFLPHLQDRGVKRSLFYVLVGAQMPAVLVEVSFMGPEKERQALSTTSYRQMLAEGIAEGIVRYTRSLAPQP